MNALRAASIASVCLIATLLLHTTIVAQQPIQDATQLKENELPKADEEAIRQVVLAIEAAWNTHDMKAYGNLLREDVHWVNVVGMHWRGRAAVMAAHIAYHNTIFKNHHLKTDSTEIRSLREGFAIAVVTTTNDSFTTPDGQVIPKRQNRLTYVLTKGSEGWKIAHGHNVAVDPVAAQFDPANRKDGPADEDLKALQGTWMTTKLVTDGKVEIDLKEPSKEGPVSTLTYNSHKWVLKLGDQELASGTSRFDPSQSPKHIDLTHESGPLKGETLLGIYKLFGDEYTACIAAPGKARPTEFASQAGSGQRLVISKREKR